MCRSFVGKVVFGLSIAVCLFGLAAVSLAEVINVDFNSSAYQGLAVAPDLAGNTAWNSVVPIGSVPNGAGWYCGSYTSAALEDSSGAATGVKVTVSADDWGWFYPNTWAATSNAAGLMSHGIGPGPYSWGTPRTFISVGGLVPGATYSLYLYEQDGASDSAVTQSVFGGTTYAATNAASDADGENEAFVKGDNYVLYSGLTADGTGAINGYVVGLVRDYAGALNGFQLVSSVPEPSALALLAAGLLAPLAYAWRKRK